MVRSLPEKLSSNVERAQRSAKKAETKGRMPLVAKAGHTAVWAGADMKQKKGS